MPTLKEFVKQKEYLFDVKLFASIRLRAESQEKAEAMIKEALDCADVNLGSWPNGSPITAELSLDDDEPDLIEVDGEPA